MKVYVRISSGNFRVNRKFIFQFKFSCDVHWKIIESKFTWHFLSLQFYPSCLTQMLRPTWYYFYYFYWEYDPIQISFFIQPTTDEEVKDVIMTLIGNKSTGPSSIPTILLKQTRNTVSLPLPKLIYKSFEAEIFLDIYARWQKWYLSSKVKQSYFAIIIDQFPCFQILVKSLKNWCVKDLIPSLNNTVVTTPLQFGFRWNYSTNSALMSIIENIQTRLDNGEFAAGVFVDLRKAFDTVNHRILILKTLTLWG